jgi:hypothetical protein
MQVEFKQAFSKFISKVAPDNKTIVSDRFQLDE